MTTAERLRAEGLAQGVAQGLAQGVAQGVAQGQRELVMRLLSQRFGALPVEAQARIATASPADLERIALRLLTAGTLDEALEA